MKKILILLTLLISSQAWTQQIEVSGKVTDDSGLPLPGGSVLVKGTTTGTTTDFDGNYKILANKGQILVFSYVGFTSQEIKITQPVVNVQLKQGEALECVTVVAYGVAKEKKRLLMPLVRFMVRV